MCFQLGDISSSLHAVCHRSGCSWDLQDFHPCSFSSSGHCWLPHRSDTSALMQHFWHSHLQQLITTIKADVWIEFNIFSSQGSFWVSLWGARFQKVAPCCSSSASALVWCSALWYSTLHCSSWELTSFGEFCFLRRLLFIPIKPTRCFRFVQVNLFGEEMVQPRRVDPFGHSPVLLLDPWLWGTCRLGVGPILEAGRLVPAVGGESVIFGCFVDGTLSREPPAAPRETTESVLWSVLCQICSRPSDRHGVCAGAGASADTQKEERLGALHGRPQSF